MIDEGFPDNPTGQTPEEIADIVIAAEKLDTYHSLLKQAVADCKAFIGQCDREGIGMQTVTDHRKRVEKFLKLATQAGVTDGI